MIVIDTQENCVHDNGCHNNVLESLRLHHFEALESEAVDWLYRNNLWICVHKQSLNFDPFLLLIGKVVGTLSLLDFFVELIDDNGNEQVHDEEGGEENEEDEDDGDHLVVVGNGHVIESYAVDSVIHHAWPHFEG
jgi:hypothetical protein